MKEQEIQALWSSQNLKIEKLMSMNSILMKESMERKSAKAMRGWFAEKILGLVIAPFYLLFLGSLLALGFQSGNYLQNYFLISVGVIFLINLKVFSDYIRHLVLSMKIDFSGPVLEIQEKLVELRMSLVRGMKIWVLQIPFYTTFHLNASWFPQNANPVWVGVQFLITGLFIGAAIWVIWTLRTSNLNSRSAKFLISAGGGDPLDKTLKVLEEIQEFQ